MKFKKIFCLILLCSLILFTGCASVEYQRVVSSDGTILDAVSVKLDKEKITNAGFDFDSAKNGVKNKMNNYLLQIVNAFQTRSDNLTLIEKFAVMNNLSYSVLEQDDYIIAGIKFKNYNAFKYFYGLHLVEDSDDDTKVVEEFLVNKYITTGKTIYSSDDAQYITNDFLAYFDNKFTLDDAELSYVFGTSSDKLYSDATNHFSLSGINFHQWIIDDVNQEINTYTLKANPINWYLLALALTLVLIIVLYIVSLFSKIKKKEEKLLDIHNEVKSEKLHDKQIEKKK